MKLKIVLFFSTLVLLFSSCGSFSDVVISDPADFKIKGFEDNMLAVSIALPAENPTAYKITVLEIESKVFLNETYLGKIVTTERVVLPPHSKDTYDLNLNIRVANIFGTAFTVMGLKTGQKVKIRLEGEVKARSLFIPKRVPINETREITI